MLFKGIRARTPQSLHLTEDQFCRVSAWLMALSERSQTIPEVKTHNGILGKEEETSVTLYAVTIKVKTTTSGSVLSGFESTHDLYINFSTIESELFTEIILSFLMSIGIERFEIEFADSKLWREFANSIGQPRHEPYLTASEITRLLDVYTCIIRASRVYFEATNMAICNIVTPTPELIAAFAKAALS